MNRQLAQKLREIAALLEGRGAIPFRIAAYRHAADSLDRLQRPVDEIYREGGTDALQTELHIGERLARAIAQAITEGRLPILDRLRGASDPVEILASVPGIGHAWADRLFHELGITSLEDLEAAAHDGRLELVSGMGPKRIAGIRDSLATRLGRTRSTPVASEPPSVEELLSLDTEYRQSADQGLLPKIAPHRFNPNHEAWLPVLHTKRGARSYTVLFSNTARAHALHRTTNWVVIYEDTGGGRSWTAITAQRGPMKGRRIVRGREAECMGFYGLS